MARLYRGMRQRPIYCNRTGRLGPDPERALGETMLSSLGRAVEHLKELLGADWEG